MATLFCVAMHGGNLHVHPEQGGHATHRVDAKSCFMAGLMRRGPRVRLFFSPSAPLVEAQRRPAVAQRAKAGPGRRGKRKNETCSDATANRGYKPRSTRRFRLRPSGYGGRARGGKAAEAASRRLRIKAVPRKTSAPGRGAGAKRGQGPEGRPCPCCGDRRLLKVHRSGWSDLKSRPLASETRGCVKERLAETCVRTLLPDPRNVQPRNIRSANAPKGGYSQREARSLIGF